jgi:type IV pilus assembly protein PilB
MLLGFEIDAALADPAALVRALDKYYAHAESVEAVISELDSTAEWIAEHEETIDLEDIRAMSESQPVKKLLNLVLLQAIRDKASDIHFEPFEDDFKMRYRIDGVLYEMVPPPRHIALAVASRIKVMANLDIAERRVPQDGRIELTVGGKPVDLRISVLPTMFGESVVMRVLDRTQVELDITKVGLRDDEQRVVDELIHLPTGIVIVTGPTGCGKTTTLYSALSSINTVDVKIITTEDPVEYDIEGLVQVQMNADIGLTFARCLRHILRQDPDIILVGEIRDLETAQIAIHSSLTGHLVFSTLHTNDAPTAITRLLDLGLEPYLVTATLEAVVAQRLVRRICTNCRAEFEPTEEMLWELRLTPEEVRGRTFFFGRGCELCNNTGYKGRTGLFEIMHIDDALRDLIMHGASTNVIRDEARKRGMRALRDAGLMGIYDGMTTIEEVIRATVTES